LKGTLVAILKKKTNSTLSIFRIYRIGIIVLFALTAAEPGRAQTKVDSLPESYLYFPYPMQAKKWQSSLGLTFTIWPEDIAEETWIHVPAVRFHFVRKLYKGFSLNGHINTQILQNMISLGPRWAYPISNKFSFSLGDDMAWWFGVLNVEGFNTKANGWTNYPNISIGYRMKRHLLLTWKMEGIIDLTYNSTVGGLNVSKSQQTYSGWSTSLILEQPFYKKTNVILGFRAIYSNFFWQTWSLFETFDREIFYPQFIVEFIL